MAAGRGDTGRSWRHPWPSTRRGAMTPTATDGAPVSATAEPRTPQRTGPGWARIFVSGLVLWSATVMVTFATRNSNLVPTIILLGSFLVPVAFVTYAFGHADPVVTAQRI